MADGVLPASGPRLALGTIAPTSPFADTIAALWLAACGHDPVRAGDGLILLPTRRSARTLADSFLRLMPGGAMLLPRMAAIGDAEEATRAPLASGLPPLPPPIEPVRRLALLSRLVLARGGRDGAPRTLDRAWPLAVELARLLDEAAREDVPLADALRTLALPTELASHWEITLDFLRIVTEAWPAILAERGVLDASVRQAMLLGQLAAHWAVSSPEAPVWLAGVNALTPTEAGLARTIARMPGGRVLLPGLDRVMADEDWAAIGPVHPQAGLKRLLERIGAGRDAVAPVAGDAVARVAVDDVARVAVAEMAPIGVEGAASEVAVGTEGETGRVAFLRRAMLPAEAVARRWRDAPVADGAISTEGISLLVAGDEQEEAVAIALVLRHAVHDGRSEASLVTPDRGLARRVAAELGRFGILADDSAGEALADTPPAVLLRLVAAVLAEAWAPATLLALLRHPLAGFGTDRPRCRRAAAALELSALRGPRPGPGPDPLRRAIGGADNGRRREAHALADRIEHALAPLAVLFAAAPVPPATLLDGLVEAAERVASTEGEGGSGADALWSGVEGEALAAHLAALRDAVDGFDPEPPERLAALLDASLDGFAVHGAPSLRGRHAAATHDRVTIRGLLEARGQRADVLVLGGLVETVWPGTADPGPWMGRTMRRAVGLPAPEERLGGEAHDFVNLVCSAGRVVLSRSERRDRAPAVPSRFLARMEASLRNTACALAADPAVGWARSLDRPAGPPRPVPPPAPRPPVARRPRQLPVTAVETWQRDPYAIHARYVLGIRELPPLEQDEDHALFGTVVHAGLAAAFAPGDGMPDAARIAAALLDALAAAPVRAGLASWWRPRLGRIAAFVAAEAAGGPAPAALAVEARGAAVLAGPAGPFTLTARADRIERAADGAVTLHDYKTGQPPTRRDVAEGWSSQLPLEAAMARRGGFGPAFGDAAIAALVHWKLSGGMEPGALSALAAPDAEAAAEAAWAGLEALIAAYDDPETAYLAEPHPGRAPRFSPYGALARVGEWRLGGGGDEDDDA